MKTFNFVLILNLFFCSCSQVYKIYKNQKEKQSSDINLSPESQELIWVDPSGEYNYSRDVKFDKNKVITRNIIQNKNKTQVLEKSILVSEKGVIKNAGMVFRPVISQMDVYLDGKRYFSQMRINRKLKTIEIQANVDNKKLPDSSHTIGVSKYICFFSQIVDCLRHHLLIVSAKNLPKNKIKLLVIWEGYPFAHEQYLGISKKAISNADFRFEKNEGGLDRFVLEIDGQVIYYHFNNIGKFIKMSWISQGISVFPIEESSALQEE